MKKLMLVLCLSLVVCASSLFAADSEKHNYKPKEGYIPDEATAIKIAEAVWLPIYGDTLADEKPFKAILKDGVWMVEGSLPEGYLGGVAEIEIAKNDGKILRVSHGK